MMNYKYIVVELCDNDFGYDLKKAVEELMDECGVNGFCTILAKRYIIEHILSKNILRGILRNEQVTAEETERLRKYLSKMRITFRNELPVYEPHGTEFVDHDGGSVYYDIEYKIAVPF